MKISFHTFSTKPEVKVPIITFKGKKKGKKGFISGGIHGDELNGIMLVKRFIEHFERYKLEEKLVGELIVAPVLNVTGFEFGQRRAKPDGLDINRAFPGKKTGSFSEQFAKELFEKFISKVDFAIDCHDAGINSALLPHTRVGSCESEGGTCATQNLGRLFGTDIIIERKGKKGMMALEAYKKLQVPLVTVEIGGANHIFEDLLRDNIKGIKNILKAHGMLPGKPVLPKKQFLLKHRFGIAAEETGIFELSIKLGETIHAGDKVGTIYHPHLYKEKDIISPMCGLVFSVHDHQIVKKGQIIFSILETEECHVARSTTRSFEELERLNLKNIEM